MTKEDKDLLLKDLCGRLPYGVVCHYGCVIPMDRHILKKSNEQGELKGIVPLSNGHIGFMVNADKVDALEGDIKPYLRPMSSMTAEEKYIYRHMLGATLNSEGESIMFVYVEDFPGVMDWLNSHHFDFRGLIEKGLALEAKEGMYKTE